MTAVIIGATGLTGRFLLKELLERREFTQVISVTRRPLKDPPAKLAQVQFADLAELPSLAPRLRGTHYFSCLGTTIKVAGSREKFARVDHQAIVEFGQIARNHQAQSFSVVSAMGANSRSVVFYNQVKGKTEDDLKSLGLRSLTIYRPSLLVGERTEVRPAEKFATLILVPLARLFPAAIRAHLVTPARTLAERICIDSVNAESGVRIVSAGEILSG